LINNAGLGHGIPTEYYPMEAARYVFDVNVFGLLEMTQKFLPLLRESKGRVVMISSLAGTVSFPQASIYCGSKFAVEAISDALRRELYKKVSFSVIEPGAVKSVLLYNAYQDSCDVMQKYNVPIEEAKRAYPKLFDKKLIDARSQMKVKSAADPDVVTSAILHAFTSKQPYARYRVANVGGVPTWLANSFMYLIPDFIMDIFVS
jgi:short-subunit dehydrogenase